MEGARLRPQNLNLKRVNINLPAQFVPGTFAVKPGNPMGKEVLQQVALVGLDEQLGSLATGETAEAHGNRIEEPETLSLKGGGE